MTSHLEKKKFYIKTFGCQMNEHDTLKMSMLLSEEGLKRVNIPSEADIILFNTCTIREKSHHKAISEVGRAINYKKKKPGLVVGIAGCVAQEEGHRLFQIFPELDFVIGPDQIHRLPEIINSGACSMIDTGLVNNPDEYKWLFGDHSHRSSMPVTEYVTIIKGCNNFCSFCIVPYVRGREVSKSPDNVIEEINNLCECGVKEITLLGQNVNSYGNDSREYGSFPRLIESISRNTDLLRLRYISPHPKDLSEELIHQHMINPILCEHIHLPVQSGSSSVLKRMNRKYSREDFISLVSSVRSAVPGISITTDMIVGFSGETEEEFNDTLNLMNEIGFDGMFAFKYSKRCGTGAAKLYKDDVDEEKKLERLSQVLELNEKIVLQKNKKYVGTAQEVLAEGRSKKSCERNLNQFTGRTRTGRIVNFESEKDPTGKLVEVEIDLAGSNSLKGVTKCWLK